MALEVTHRSIRGLPRQRPWNQEMEPQNRRPGACPGCHNPAPDIRNKISRLYRKTFLFHFRNLRWALGRNNTFLCYQVDREERDSTVPIHRGVFKTQVFLETRLHAELCFLYWLHDYPLQFPDQHLQITWFVSWSPCSDCAQQVAAFLASHSNLSLTIYAARLYYFWNHSHQEGLRALQREGARVEIMSLREFEHCWENFVYPYDGRPFRPWKNLIRNYHFQVKKLQKILPWDPGTTELTPEGRGHLSPAQVTPEEVPGSWCLLVTRRVMKLLKKETFHQQFNNQHRAPRPYCRRKTYLCYQLQLKGSPCDQDYFQNKKDRHAEIRFIKKIRSLDLDRSQNYEVTCYLTWSPCPNCAQELVELTRSHPHVRLRLFTSRLYFHWLWRFQEGLRLLWRSGVQIWVMSLREFTHCWVKFVNHGGCPFEPELWDRLEQHSQSIQNRLNRILGLTPVTATCATSCPHPCCSAVLSLEDLTANFRNLQL
ncbi:DNA dC-_dU-editing enzyme APOBEC3-like [Marmota flaviventris]|uniref:DNA dC->dU-editing enzyme APOBEC3-like n=1 Tax=Marmota flaviventris TaxID=93162 RepID=UPI003A86D484